MLSSVLLLLLGVLLAWVGGTLFVEGSAALAKWARWPAAAIGVTIAAFGTSSPELMVAIQASMDGVPQISLGDVLGSNVVNIALILALVLSLSGMRAKDETIPRDWASAMAVPFLLGVVLRDGWFSRLEAAALIAIFTAWLTVVIWNAAATPAGKWNPCPTPTPTPPPPGSECPPSSTVPCPTDESSPDPDAGPTSPPAQCCD
ncbi:MAG TPA: hypothetical protein VD994_14700 [Prosthecobacter sp.]|nr:hypothetical protein [Prosthecobacter sp.]